MTWGGQGRAFWVHFALGEGQMGTLSRPHFHPFHSRGGSRGGGRCPSPDITTTVHFAPGEGHLRGTEEGH